MKILAFVVNKDLQQAMSAAGMTEGDTKFFGVYCTIETEESELEKLVKAFDKTKTVKIAYNPKGEVIYNSHDFHMLSNGRTVEFFKDNIGGSK